MTSLKLLQILIVLAAVGYQFWINQRLDAAPDVVADSGRVLRPAMADNGSADNGTADNSADNDTADNSADNGSDDNSSDNESDNVAEPTIVVIRPNTDSPRAPPPQSTPSTPSCSTPGHDMIVTSPDGKATVRVFANMPEPVQIVVQPFFDLMALPPTPGRLAGLLVYDVIAARCGGDPLLSFPAEVNLNVQYDDEDVDGLVESSLMFSYMDPQLRVWRPVEKQSLDARRNAIGATISHAGRYIVYEDP